VLTSLPKNDTLTSAYQLSQTYQIQT